MGRLALLLLLAALAVAFLPVAAFVLLDSRGAGPPAMPAVGPPRDAEQARVVRVQAEIRADERRLAVSDAGPPTVLSPPATPLAVRSTLNGASPSEPETVVTSKPIVSGQVFTASGRPAAEAYLMLNRADELGYRGTIYTVAGEDGSFAIEVEAGTAYHVVAIPPLTRDLRDHERLAMGAAYVRDLVAPVKDLEIRMRPTDTVSGIVRDAGGVPIAGEQIRISDDVIGILNWGRTDDFGHFELLVPQCSKVRVSVFDETISYPFQCESGDWRTVMEVTSDGPLQVVDLRHER
jgi:hypothetical protein